METIIISWYIKHDETTHNPRHGISNVEAYSLTEAIEIVRKMHDHSIFVYKACYADINRVIASL